MHPTHFMILLPAFTVLLCLAYCLMFVVYRKGWKRVPYYHPGSLDNRYLPFLSVIISARNESRALPHLLNDLRMQSLPEDRYEVIIVDDHSEDNTAEIVLKRGGNVRLISLAEHLTAQTVAYKKAAIAAGIAQAKGDVIVCTDADCRVPPHWLLTIARFFQEEHPDFVVMPVFMEHHNRLGAIFQSVDFMTMQGITAAAVQEGWYNMANGANLAYTKKSFLAVNGFTGIDQLASGDDMLLMRKIKDAHPNGIRYLKSAEVIVSTAPCEGIGEFLSQRARWASKFGHYRSAGLSVVLVLVFLLNLLLILLPVSAILFRLSETVSSSKIICVWLMIAGAKIFAELYFLYPVARFFHSRKLLWWFIPLQPLHWIYIVFAGALGMMRPYQWKGRRYA